MGDLYRRNPPESRSVRFSFSHDSPSNFPKKARGIRIGLWNRVAVKFQNQIAGKVLRMSLNASLYKFVNQQFSKLTGHNKYLIINYLIRSNLTYAGTRGAAPTGARGIILPTIEKDIFAKNWGITHSFPNNSGQNRRSRLDLIVAVRL